MRNKIGRSKIGKGLFLALLPLCLGGRVEGASFDCSKATTPVEKLICATPESSILDEELASAYTEALKKAREPALVKQKQRAWLKERNLCNDSSCINDHYRQRLAVLSQVITGFPTIFPADISEFKIDCAKADSKAKKIICKQDGSPLEQEWLARLDREMLPELQWALMRGRDKQKILDTQRQWQQKRDTCENALGCVVDVYSKRRMELKATWERPDQCYVLKPLSDAKDKPQVDADGNVQTIEPVCQAMEENLNQFCDQPPMVCGLQVAPRFQQLITFPEWTPLGPEANLVLIEEFIKAPREDSPNKKAPQKMWEAERPKIEAALAAKRLTFSEARLDIFNLGTLQLAYRLDYGTCRADNPQLANKDEWGRRAKSAPIKIQHAPAVIRQLFKDYSPIGSGTVQETFLYGGKTYTYWMMRGEEQYNYPLYVNRHERWVNPVSLEVHLTEHNKCRFDYQPNKEESK
ncbi:MAG: DUF1311 domain-containing protein [Deltaproteobacteria bacterium]|nr:DUF1311 domain-containing protein [Deltaproteobacteria bacterium]